MLVIFQFYERKNEFFKRIFKIIKWGLFFLYLVAKPIVVQVLENYDWYIKLEDEKELFRENVFSSK